MFFFFVVFFVLCVQCICFQLLPTTVNIVLVEGYTVTVEEYTVTSKIQIVFFLNPYQSNS